MKKTFSRKEHTDAGLALALILIFINLKWHKGWAIDVAFVGILLLMIKSSVFYPFTFVWLNGSDALGKIVSKILLGIIFFLFVVPVGFFRKMKGSDNLKLTEFKKKNDSVFVDRNRTFKKEDLLNPY